MKTTIQRAFLSASLICSACASKGAPGGDDGTGDDGGGSGSGSGSGDPTGTLTFDDTGFFVDNPVRWSANPTPMASGTISDDTATLDVVVANHSIAQATIAAGTWTVTLPASSVGVVPTDVSFVAKKNGHDIASLTRKIAVDVTPPVLAAMPSKVQNELNDVIALGPAGEITSHTHVDTNATTLGVDGCPDVFKHGYLMDPGDSNPIHWKLVASDDGVGIDPASAMVRVGRADGTQFGPWRPVSGAATAGTIIYDLDVLRSGPTGDAFVATTEGKLVVQLTAKDRLNRETTFERCWTQHPLAVPLLATAAAFPGEGNPFGIRGNSLGIFGDLARLAINSDSTGLSIMDFELFNGTQENTVVTFTLGRPAMKSFRDYAKQSVLDTVETIDVNCDNLPQDPRCLLATLPPKLTSAGTQFDEDASHFVVRVFTVAANGTPGAEVPCNVCDATGGVWRFPLPGKSSANAPSAHFRVMTGVRGIHWIPSGAAGDADAGPFEDRVIGLTNTPITGKLLATFSGCTKTETKTDPKNPDKDHNFCTEFGTYQQYRALTRIELDFSTPLTSQIASAPVAQVTPRSIASLAAPRSLASLNFVSTVTLPPQQ